MIPETVTRRRDLGAERKGRCEETRRYKKMTGMLNRKRER